MHDVLIQTIIKSEATIKVSGERQFLLFGELPVRVENVADLRLTPYQIGNGDLQILAGGESLSKMKNDLYGHVEGIYLSEGAEPFALITKGYALIKGRGKHLRLAVFNPNPNVTLIYRDHSKTEVVENNTSGGGQGMEELLGVIKAHRETDGHGFLMISKRAPGNFLVTPVLDQSLPELAKMTITRPKVPGAI